MAKFVGGALRIFQTFLYVLAFLCAAIILGIYSYFLSVLANRNLPIAQWKKATEGISGAAVVYTIFAVILTCCLGGIPFFAFLALVLDILFCAGFIALAILTRHGAGSCSGYVHTPLGDGPSNSNSQGYGDNGFGFGNGQTVTYSPNLSLACRLNSAAFAVSIIGAFVFLIAAFMQIALARHHKKEKRFGPSPANNYTSGSGRRRWFASTNRRNRNVEKDAEIGTAAGAGALAVDHHQHHHDTRPSHDTGFTGSTVAGTTHPHPTLDPAKTGNHAAYHNAPINTGNHAAYHNAPTNTTANPYGYENTHPTGTASNF